MKTADLSSPKEVEIFRQAQAELKESGISFTNCFRSVVLQIAEPTEEDTMPDIERLTWAIRENLGVEDVDVPYAVMVKLASVLRENDFPCVSRVSCGATAFSAWISPGRRIG